MSDIVEQTPVPAEGGEAAAAVATAPAAAVEKPKAVFVENLSPSVNTKMLNEFFSLCGAIETITVRPKPGAEDGTLEAIVFFESSGAADTAVLLTNAILVDRNISITYFKGSDGKDTKTEPSAAADADAAAAPAGDGSSPSVWASIVAASYKISDDITKTLNQVDEKYNVTKGFTETMDKIDQTLGLSEKATAFSNAVHQKSEELHVNEKIDAMGASLTQATESVKATANNMFDSAMQNQYFNSAWTTLSGWGTAIVSSFTSIAEEADQLYTRQTGNVRGAQNQTPDGSAATAAAADPDTVTVPVDASQTQESAPSVPTESPDEVKMPEAPAN